MSATAGYSGTPLVRKLGIKPGARLGLIGAPPDFDATLGELPLGVEVRRRLPALRAALDPAGGLWIAWPKGSSGLATDLSDSVVRKLGLDAGLVDNKVCAIDQTWSGLRFVYRLRDRPT